APTATLNCPLVLSASALVPTAVLLIPVEAGFSALFPSAVELPLQLLGHCALSGGESANQASAQTMRHTGVTFLNRRMNVSIRSFPLSSPLVVSVDCGSGRDEEPSGARNPLPDSEPFSDSRSLAKIMPASQTNSPQAEVCRFEFQKRSQLFIGTHNETLSVVAVCVSTPDRAAFTIQG